MYRAHHFCYFVRWHYCRCGELFVSIVFATKKTEKNGKYTELLSPPNRVGKTSMFSWVLLNAIYHKYVVSFFFVCLAYMHNNEMFGGCVVARRLRRLISNAHLIGFWMQIIICHIRTWITWNMICIYFNKWLPPCVENETREIIVTQMTRNKE